MSVYDLMDCLKSLQEFCSSIVASDDENNRYIHFKRLLHRIQGLQSKLIALSYHSRDENKKYVKVIQQLASALKELQSNHHSVILLNNSCSLGNLSAMMESFGDISYQLLQINAVLHDVTLDLTSMSPEDSSDLIAFLSGFVIYSTLSDEEVQEFKASSWLAFGHTDIENFDVEGCHPCPYPVPHIYSSLSMKHDYSYSNSEPSNQSLFSVNNISKNSVNSYRVGVDPPESIIFRIQSVSDTCGSTISSMSHQGFIPRLKIPNRIRSSQKQITIFLDAVLTGNLKLVDHFVHETYVPFDQVRDYHGNSALGLAAEYGHFDVMQYLLNCKIPINSVNHFGFTPLIICSKNGFADCVRLLLQRGADPTILSKDNKSAKDFAKLAGHNDIKRMIKLKLGLKCGGLRFKLFGINPSLPSLELPDIPSDESYFYSDY